MALNINPQPYEVQGHDQFEIEAEGLGRYTIDVSVPENIAEGDTLHVILVNDGNLFFDIAHTVTHGRGGTAARFNVTSLRTHRRWLSVG